MATSSNSSTSLVTSSTKHSAKNKRRNKKKLAIFQKTVENSTEPKIKEPTDRLYEIYKKTILPLEKAYNFPIFYSPSLSENYFKANPIVLCIGQYSTGKTSFIKYLLERDFPGLRIGPEPTTDRFVAVMKGESEKLIPGNAAAAQPNKPFGALKKYGMAFLNKFECTELNSPILDHISFVDTPGVLAGLDSKTERSYDFAEVIKWFAERVDRILLFFDVNKLNISNEMKKVIKALEGNEDKIMCVLNKADSVNSQQLMRVYGALMWSLGKVINTPEVPRIYIGSFWDKEYQNKDIAPLLDAEESDLLSELRSLPRNSVTRKVNEIVKRAKTLKIHCLLLSHLKEQVGHINKAKRQKRLLANLPSVFDTVRLKNELSKGDFPDPKIYREVLLAFDMAKFKKITALKMAELDRTISAEIPPLLERTPVEKKCGKEESKSTPWKANPFDGEEGESERADRLANGSSTLFSRKSWVVSGPLKSKFDHLFDSVCGKDEKVNAETARELMYKSGLCVETLKSVWDLSDIDGDSCLDRDEFSLCMYLLETQSKNGGIDLKKGLPLEYIPPSKRLLD